MKLATSPLSNLSLIHDHLETDEEELISNVGGENCFTEHSSDLFDKQMFVAIMTLCLEVNGGGPSDVEIVGDVLNCGSQQIIPSVVVEDEVIDLADGGGFLELGVVKLESENEVVPIDFGNETHSSVEHDGKLLLIASLSARNGEIQIESTVSLVTNDNALNCVHGDWLGVGLLGEGQQTRAFSVHTVVSLKLGHEEFDLFLETLASKSLHDGVEGGVDQRLVDPKLFLLFLASVVGKLLVSGNESADIITDKVTINMDQDLSLFVAEFGGLGCGDVELHGDVDSEGRDVKDEGVGVRVHHVSVENIDKACNGTLDKLEAIVDQLLCLRHQKVHLLLPEFLGASETERFKLKNQGIVQLPGKLIRGVNGQIKLHGDVNQSEFGDFEGNDNTCGHGIDSQGNVHVRKGRANNVGISNESH